MKKILIVMTILAVLITACVPGQTPEDAQALINTAVAAAIATQQRLIDQAVSLTLTAVAQNPSPTPDGFTPTNTPLSFPTLTPIIPTITPLVINTPSGGGGGGGVPLKRDYDCDSINRRPKDNTEFHSGDDFDIKWTIVNTGTKTWDSGFDVKYFSGPQMSYITVVQIPVQMKPGDKYDIVMDAAAPLESGFHVMTWIVQGKLCYPYVAINVK